MAISKIILNGVTQMDVTGTTAVAYDVASGKKFIRVDGTEGTGTASGGGSIEMESGVYTVVSDSTTGIEIPFTNVHSDPPVIFCIVRDVADEEFSNYPVSVMALSGVNFAEALNASAIETKATSPYHVVGLATRYSRTSSSMSITGLNCTTDAATTWSMYATATKISTGPTDTVRAGKYKWFAIWKCW